MQNDSVNRELTRWALTQTTVSCGLDRLALVALAGLADENGYASPPMKTLTEIVMYGEPTLRKALQRLGARKLIRRVKSGSSAQPGPTVYEILGPGAKSREG